MRKCIIFLLLSYCLSLNAQEDTTENLHLWSSQLLGLNTKFQSQNILDTQFQDCSNVFFDEDLSIVRRGGYAKFNTVPVSSGSVRFCDEFTRANGSKYMITVTSNTLAYTSTGSFIVLISTLNIKSVIWGIQFLDNYFIGGDKDDSWQFDGSVFCSTTISQCKYALVNFDKIFIANLSADGQGSKIVYSRIGLVSFEGDAYIYFNRDDGEKISGMCVYNGNIYIFKPHSIGILVGVDDEDTTNDGIITVSKGIGCLHNSTIQIKDNVLIFQSHRGIESFDGSNLTLLSELITPIINGLSTFSPSVRYNIDTSNSDFNVGSEWLGVSINADSISSNPLQTLSLLGTITDTSIDIDTYGNPHIAYCYQSGTTQGVVIYSSWTSTVHSWSTNFVSSNIANTQFEYIRLKLDSYNNPYIIFTNKYGSRGIYISSVTSNGNWNVTNISGILLTNLVYISLDLDSLNNPHIAYNNDTTYNLFYASYTNSSKSWTVRINIDSTGDVGKYCSLKLDSSANPHIAYLDNTNYYLKYTSFTGGIGWSITTIDDGSDSPVKGNISLDLDSSNNGHISYNKNNYNLCYASYTVSLKQWNKNTLNSYSTGRTSLKLNNLGCPYILWLYSEYPYLPYLFISSITCSANNFSLNGDQLISYNGREMFSMELYNNQKPMISYIDTDVNLKFYTAYMYYISGIKNVTPEDSTFLNWNNFTVLDSIPDFTTIKYYVFTANSSATLGISSTTNLSGQQIISQLQPFVKYKLIMEKERPATDSEIVVNEVIVENTITESIYLPCSTIKDRRYWYSGAESPSVNNSIVLVLDKYNNWTKFKGINARSFVTFNNELYFGTSGSDGLIYHYSDDLNTDDGTPIETMIQTKDFDLGSRLVDKKIAMEGLWTDVEPTNVYSTMTIAYCINKSTIPEISVDIDIRPDSNYSNNPIITRNRNYIDRFRYINFKITNFNKFNSLDLFYVKQPIGEK